MTTAAACPPGQTGPTPFAVVINGRVVYDPQPKQLAFHQSTARRPLYGGAAGGGKSKALRWHLIMACLQVPGLKCLLLRRQLKDLERSHEREIPKEVAALNSDPSQPLCEWLPSLHTLRFWNGALIEFGHCQHEENFQNYLSAEYDLIAFDELVTFSRYQFEMISSRCRTTIPGFTPRILCATNPGGPESQWVRQLWLDHDVDRDEYPDYDPADYVYIPATLDDNQHINQLEYRRTLMGIPPELRRAYLEGDWDIFVGQFFPEFRRSLHVTEMPPAPREWQRYGGLDWGYQKEGVYLWAVHHPDGFLDIEDEFVFNGPRRDKKIARLVAAEIVRRNRARGITVRRTYADPAMNDARGHETSETMLQTFRKHGVPAINANNERVDGWARVRAWLSRRPDGLPFMRVHPRCTYLIRTFGAVVMDAEEPEDLDTDGPDHALDALRYIVMGRPEAPGARVETSFPYGTVGHLKQQIMAAPRRVLGEEAVRRKHHVH